MDFYDCAALKNWRDGIKDADGDCIEGREEAFAEALARWQAANRTKAETPTKTLSGVTVRWLEWAGTRKHPKATAMQVAGVTVEDRGGKFVTVKFPDGRTMKKGRDTNGFEVIGADGRRIWL